MALLPWNFPSEVGCSLLRFTHKDLRCSAQASGVGSVMGNGGGGGGGGDSRPGAWLGPRSKQELLWLPQGAAEGSVEGCVSVVSSEADCIK